MKEVIFFYGPAKNFLVSNYVFNMKCSINSLIVIVLISTSVFAQSQPVKMSVSSICHPPGSTYYEQTKKFTPFKTLQDCLKAGGRLPKR